jgi:hypothetical protein
MIDTRTSDGGAVTDITAPPHTHVWGPCHQTKLSGNWRQVCTVYLCTASQACTP